MGDPALEQRLAEWRLAPAPELVLPVTRNRALLCRTASGRSVFVKANFAPLETTLERESRVLQAISPWLRGAPLAIPKRHRVDPAHRILAVEWLDDAETFHARVRRTGRLELARLRAIGRALRALHTLSASRRRALAWAKPFGASLLHGILWTRPGFYSRLSHDGVELIGRVQSDAKAMRALEALARPSPDESCLAHGDFRPANVMIRPKGPPVLVDWELAHWGDPMEDLGCFSAHLLRNAVAPDQQVDSRSPEEAERMIAALRAGYGRLDEARERRFWWWVGAHLVFYAHAIVLGDGKLHRRPRLLLKRGLSLLRRGRPHG